MQRIETISTSLFTRLNAMDFSKLYDITKGMIFAKIENIGKSQAEIQKIIDSDKNIRNKYIKEFKELSESYDDLYFNESETNPVESTEAFKKARYASAIVFLLSAQNQLELMECLYEICMTYDDNKHFINKVELCFI
jgi:DNA gyrase/topoisomerase IV subunit A